MRRLGRLQPGKLFLVDLERGRIVEDEEVKREVSTQQPYGEWYAAQRGPHLASCRPPSRSRSPTSPCALRQRAFGYSQEDLRVLLTPMAIEGAEPVGSMGNDLALAVLSDQAPPLFSYFKQLFAQVTNPPIDPIREEIVMSLATSLGIEQNLFDETPEHAHKLAARPADPAEPRPRDAAQRQPRGLRGRDDRHLLAGGRGPRGHGAGARARLRTGPRRDRARA